MANDLNMMIVGEAGQGIVLITRILASAIMADGFRVLTTDVPASTHRTGVTYSHIRSGAKVDSLRIEEGEVNLLLALDPIDGLMIGLEYIAEDCRVILSNQVLGKGLISLKDVSIDRIVQSFQRAGIQDISVIDSGLIVKEEKVPSVCNNMVMLGAALGTGLIPAKMESIEQALREFSPPGLLKENLKAMKGGFHFFKQAESARVKERI